MAEISTAAAARRLLRGANLIARRYGVSRATVFAWRDRGLPVFQAAERTSPLVGWSDELDKWFSRNAAAKRSAG